MRETYAPVLLERKAKTLRKSTGNLALVVERPASAPASASELFWRTITRPSKMILFSPIILSLGVYTGIVFAYLYLMLVTFTEIYEQKYGFSIGVTGLMYLGMCCSIIWYADFLTIFIRPRSRLFDRNDSFWLWIRSNLRMET